MRVDPISVALILLVLAAVVAAFTMKSIWFRVVPAALALGPLSYGLLGLGLARFAPPGRIGFFSVPLNYYYWQLNIVLWVLFWGVLLAWFWRRRAARAGAQKPRP